MQRFRVGGQASTIPDWGIKVWRLGDASSDGLSSLASKYVAKKGEVESDGQSCATFARVAFRP